MSQTRVDTIIGGGQVVTSSEVFDAAIAIVGDKIAAIGPRTSPSPRRPIY